MFNNLQISPKKLLTIIGIMTVLIGLYIAWSIIFFRITGTTPGGKTYSVDTPYVVVNFNKKLGVNTPQQITGTDKLIKSIDFKEKSIRINFRTLQLDQKYTISLNTIRSASGDELSKTITFTAKEIEFDKLPKDQQKILIDNQDQDPGTADPILAFLPYGGENFRLSASPTTDQNLDTSVALTAELFLSKADLDIRAEAEAAYKQQVVDYIQSVGLKAENYTITYSVIEPAINLTEE